MNFIIIIFYIVVQVIRKLKKIQIHDFLVVPEKIFGMLPAAASLGGWGYLLLRPEIFPELE